MNSEGALFTQPWRCVGQGRGQVTAGRLSSFRPLGSISSCSENIPQSVAFCCYLLFLFPTLSVFLKVLVSCLCVSFELCMQDLRQEYKCRPAYYISINTKIINIANTLLVKRVLLFCLDNYTFIVTWKSRSTLLW